jgi:YVTN family beta-propeller protein
MEKRFKKDLLRAGLLASTFLIAPHLADAAVTPNNLMPLPTGVFISPTAVPGANQQFLNPQLAQYPNFIAGEAVKSQLSPDGNTLAIVTAGENSLNFTSGSTAGKTDVANSTQYVFVYDVSGANKAKPVLTQVIQQMNAHVGLAWNGNQTLYATGGVDDKVYVYSRTSAAPSAQFSQTGAIALGHNKVGIGGKVQPNASGLGVSADGKTLVVANNYNDSISVIDTASQTVVSEYDLRPYNTSGQDGVAGGEYPWAVAMKADGKAFISSVRDRELVVLDLSTPASPKFLTRIALTGNPYGMTFSPDQSKLFVAEDNTDLVAVIDTGSYAVQSTIDTRGPSGILAGNNNGNHNGEDGDHHSQNPHYTGAAPIAVTLSPDGKTLYAVNNGSNSIAVIPLTGEDANTVTALIPTAYAPKDVTFSADGSQMFIINGKSDQGPNPGHLSGNTFAIHYLGSNAQAMSTAANATNEYQFQMERASLVSAPVPTGHSLDDLTTQVAKNNLWTVRAPESQANVMGFLNGKIKHVIYIVKENRTFDQVLGDLTNGANGDPSITQFGKAITPNYHRLAEKFVTLDNFMDPADGSMDGWSWSMHGRVTNLEEITQQENYASVNRGLSYESEGSNRNIPVGLATAAQRDAATSGAYTPATAGLKGGTNNVLPGPADVSGIDTWFGHQVDGKPTGYQQSFIFDAVLDAGKTVRNYGWMVNNIGPIVDSNGNPITTPYPNYVQVAELNPTLANGMTDVYFRGFDQNYSDLWDFKEWNREFQQFDANGNLPSLETVRLSHDHMGSFSTALAGVNYPEAQQADNDYAVAKMIEAVAHSRYAKDTLFIITEDDSQDGPDHVDSHRAPAYFVGPYVKQGQVVSTRYNQVSVLRTIEDILGTKHMNLNTAYAAPMSDVFDINSSGHWTYNAVASTVLQNTNLQLSLADIGVQYAEGPVVMPKHDAAYWAKATRGFDFSKEDRVPPALYNKVLWEGMMGNKPYPVVHTEFKTTAAN